MNDKYQPDVVVEHNDITYLIETAKGSGRSYEAYARMAGISSAAMSKIRSGKYKPSPETLRKLSSDKANPQGGVTYEDFMKSLGYAGESESDTDQHSDTLSQYEKEITSQIYTALFEKFKTYERKLSFRGELSLLMYDMDLKMFTGEYYLANAVEGDVSREIYLS